MQDTLQRRKDTAGIAGHLERRNYLIDRFPVSYQGGAAWHCQCREFAMAHSCRHTREASGMRDAQMQIKERLGGRTASLVTEIRAR